MRLSLVLFFSFSFLACGPDLSEYESLKEPQLSSKGSEQVLMVRLVGRPEETSSRAFSLLFSAYYDLEDPGEGKPPRARWFSTPEVPREEWVAEFAIPVANSVKLDAEFVEEHPDVKLVTWDYGDVVEVMHVGPYDRVGESIERLSAFVGEKGYRLSGAHEEEYIRGPGMIFSGDPEDYHTIVRYSVETAK